MKSVLLLDDDRDFRSLAAAALRAAQLEVVEAGTIAAATKTFTHIAVDLVVVDGLLPDGDGTAFIESLRAHNRKVRIIFVSAFVRDLATVEHLTKELDVSGVIYKPIDIGDFTDQVLQLFGMPKAPAAPSAPPDLAAEFAALNAQYSAKLPKKLQEIETAIERAKTDHDSIADARGLAHRLRGSAGSYGHPALSEAIACAEDLLAEAQANPSAIRRHLWEEIDTALRDSRLCLERGPEFNQGSPTAAATQ